MTNKTTYQGRAEARKAFRGPGAWPEAPLDDGRGRRRNNNTTFNPDVHHTIAFALKTATKLFGCFRVLPRGHINLTARELFSFDKTFFLFVRRFLCQTASTFDSTKILSFLSWCVSFDKTFFLFSRHVLVPDCQKQHGFSFFKSTSQISRVVYALARLIN